MDDDVQQDIEPKKRRGRPPKIREVEPVEPVTDSGEVSPRAKKAGRPRKKNANFLPDTDDLARQLQGWHAIAAQIAKTPELAIDSGEAKMLAQAVVNVAKEYDLTVSGKTAAWVGLIATAGAVYAPRAIMLAPKLKAQKKAGQKAPLMSAQSNYTDAPTDGS